MKTDKPTKAMARIELDLELIADLDATDELGAIRGDTKSGYSVNSIGGGTQLSCVSAVSYSTGA